MNELYFRVGMPSQFRRLSREGTMSFVVGAARAQLEIDLVQREGGWLGGSPVSFLPGHKNCFPLLLHCLGKTLVTSILSFLTIGPNSCLLIAWPYGKGWP
jgi:hypothetical protein